MTNGTENGLFPESNALIDRARIRGASRMITQGTEAKDVTREQIVQVGQDVELFCQKNKVHRRTVARAIGYNPSVISEFLKGSYKGNAGQVAIDLDDWLVEEEQRRANAQTTTFVWTNVAQQIRAVAEWCLDKQKVGLVYGPETSGLGKTTSMLAISQTLGPRRSTFVTIDKCDANPTGLLKKILAGMRLGFEGNNAQKMQRIVDNLKDTSHILLIDQIHNLRYAKEDRPLYYLMDIYEASKTAQLWSGTSDIVSYLERQRVKTLDEPLAQIRSRIFPCVDLIEICCGNPDGGGSRPLYTVDEIREIFSQFQFKLTPAGARWLCFIACKSGSGALRIASNIMEYATMVAQMRNLTSVDVSLLKEALQYTQTKTRAKELITAADAAVAEATRRVA